MSTDPRGYLDRSWVDRYRSYLPEARKWWASQTGTMSRYGVEKSTLRAYSTGLPGAKHGPGAIFNEWAQVQASSLETWPADAGAAEFERLHERLGETLRSHWRARRAEIQERLGGPRRGVRIHEELSVAQTHKMVDLFVRHLWLAPRDKQPRQADAVWRHAHAPLDRKSLRVLSACYSGILMARTFSMGMVLHEAQYRWCQSLIRFICEKAGGTPLLFDRFAWVHADEEDLWTKR